MDKNLNQAALEYHRLPKPGKIEVVPTKGLATQRDLALAYTPGVEMHRRMTLIAAMMVRQGDADAMICGTVGLYRNHLHYVRNVIGLRPGIHIAAAMNMILHPKGTLFICDTYVNPEPTAEEIAAMTILAAEVVSRFGIAPKVTLLSHSSFGTSDIPSLEGKPGRH